MQLPSISLNREALMNFEDAIKKEWIVTNGLGGYASSTVLGINTRKYHGLLVAALHPPGDRRVCLAKLDEEVSIGNDTYALGANEFQSDIFPKGHTFLKGVSVSPFPRYVYSAKNVELRKTIFMPNGKNSAIILYRVFNGNASEAKIKILPFANWRHFHWVTDRWRTSFEINQSDREKAVAIQFRPPETALLISSTSGHFWPDKKWVDKIYLREEALRGETCLDDYYVPGRFEVSVKGGKAETFALVAVAGNLLEEVEKVSEQMPITMYDLEGLFDVETKMRMDFVEGFYRSHKEIPQSDWLAWLVLSSGLFPAKGITTRLSVIAGYHWFESWGRDAFVSLPGLILATGRFDDAKNIIQSFASYCRGGLIPNFIPDRGGDPPYNTVDASLWFINSVLQYLKYTGDFGFVEKNLWKSLKDIVDAYVKGTEFSIHMDSDGLISHDPQLTWMDVAVEGVPLTPRGGKAVEVQALWFNALKTVELLAHKFKELDEAERFEGLAEKARRAFVDQFWDNDRNRLFDCCKGGERDSSLRPNQIFAVSTDFAMLDNVRSEKVVDAVHQELLTPYGLRTLARSDPRYIGIYAGGRNSRDRAYHNGSVWPWLLGPFVTAFLKTKGYTEFRKDLASGYLLPLLSKQVYMAGLGSLSEIYDGESPQTPRGCIAQAWSVAEPLRAYVEDVLGFRPRFENEMLKRL